jgi:hypothetical protein
MDAGKVRELEESFFERTLAIVLITASPRKSPDEGT